MKEYDHYRFRWDGEGGFLATSGYGVHSNVQVLKGITRYQPTSPIPLWWFFRGRPA